MRVLHLTSTFFPKNTGGKEVFVYHLIKGSPHIEHLVVYHQGPTLVETSYEQIPVRILPRPIAQDPYKSYWSLVYDDLPKFTETLEGFKPDLVHFHDFCAGASLSHLRICKEKRLKTMVTYHSPGNSCMQKGLIRANQVPCDGEIIDERCTRCRYQIKGMPGVLASVLAAIKIPDGSSGRLLLRNSTAIFHESFREFFATVDAVQVHAQWVRDVLVLNNVPAVKINMVQLGGHPSVPVDESNPADKDRPLRMAFIGRCVNIKGAHILVDAIRRLPPDAKIEVHFLGPNWDDSAYGAQLKKMTEHDTRFKLPRLVLPEQVIHELKTMDICVIPSLWPETGPLSLLDAFAARVPVIGTDHAGIRERVVHGKTGLLFKWGDSEDLARQIRYVLDNRETLQRFRQAIPINYTFNDMAGAIGELYKKIIR